MQTHVTVAKRGARSSLQLADSDAWINGCRMRAEFCSKTATTPPLELRASDIALITAHAVTRLSSEDAICVSLGTMAGRAATSSGNGPARHVLAASQTCDAMPRRFFASTCSPSASAALAPAQQDYHSLYETKRKNTNDSPASRPSCMGSS